MFYKQLKEDVLIFVGDGYESASTVFLDEDKALLVDTLATEEDALWMRDALHKMGKEVRCVVMTHYMNDHMAGLRLFRNAVTIAHRYYRGTFLSQSNRDDAFYVEPQVTFEGEMTIRWGGNKLHLIHNPGKTMDHVTVDAPTADLVCAGDNIVGNITYLSRADPDEIDRAICQLQQYRRSWVVSGHMGLFPAATLDNARIYLSKLRSSVIRLREGHSTTDAQTLIARIPIETCLAPDVNATAFERDWHRANLDVIQERRLFELDVAVAKGAA